MPSLIPNNTNDKRPQQTNVHPETNDQWNQNGQYNYGNNYGNYAQDVLDPSAKWDTLRDNQRYNNTQAGYDYLNNVKDVQNKLRNDMARESSKYQTGIGSASQNYTDAVNTQSNSYKNEANANAGNFNSQINDYLKTVSDYIGNRGYQNTLKQAQQGATQQANNAAASAMGAARSAGMNKAQAAALGMGNAINAYNQGLAQQQAQVANNYNNALNTYGNQLNQQSNIYGQLSNATNNAYGQNVNAAGNRYGQTVGALNNSYATNANTINSASNNLTNALAQDIAQRQNQQNINYSNQDVIEKLLTGLDSGIFGGGLSGATGLVSNLFNLGGLLR